MKLVIDISEDDYRKVQDGRASVSMMRKTIRNGTPLPKGHGRLIDADKLIKNNGLDNNDILEFIVDEKYLPKGVYGDMSAAGPEFEGDVSHMIIYDFWIEGFGNGS